MTNYTFTSQTPSLGSKQPQPHINRAQSRAKQLKGKLGLFYPLTNEELRILGDILIYSELRVLLHLRTLDPFGDRKLQLTVTQIALDLNLRKGTISKALKTLERRGYIGIEITEATIQVHSQGIDLEALRAEAHVFRRESKGFLQETSESHRKPQNPTGNTQSPEPLPEKDSRSSNTLNTDQTLSESTSENINPSNTHVDPQAKETIESGSDLKSKVQVLDHPTKNEQDQCSANRSGGVENDLPIYRTGAGPDGLNESFVEFIRLWLCTIAPQRDRARGDALAYIRNQEKTDDLSILICRAMEWKQAQNQAEANQQRRSTLQVMDRPPAPVVNEETPEERLSRYQLLWQTPPCRAGVRHAIATHPEWNLEITEAGPHPVQKSVETSPIQSPPKVWKLGDECITHTDEPEIFRPDSNDDQGLVDLGDLLVAIDIHCSRLQWSKQDAIAHMIEKYGWSPHHPASKHNTLDPLTDEDLIALLEALMAQSRQGV